MAFIPFQVFLVLLFSTLILTSATTYHQHQNEPPSSPPEIYQACQATRYPDICETTLSQYSNLPKDPTPLQIVQSAMEISYQNLKTAQSMVKTILDSSSGNPNKTNAAQICIEVLNNSEYRLNSTVNVLPFRMKDGRAWMSAALAYQYVSWSALKYVNDTQQINETMAFMINSLINVTSNALSMLRSYDLFGEEMYLWQPPATERYGFWEDNSISGIDMGFKGGFPSNLTQDVTVCKEEGKGCVKTVQEAVNKAPNDEWGSKFVIKIDEGIYTETVRVPLEKKNVVFLGDGIGKTVITGSLHVGLGISTYNTATVGVIGEGFMARDITFENTAGPDAHQAVAFRSDSDLSIVENCEFLGNQDTLYAHSLRQYYKSCRIEGNVDFIFGNSASVFQDCTILIRPRQQNATKGEKNAVTAHGRTDPAQSTGFVFQNCLINGTEEYMALYYSNPKVHKNFLGRPWKEYSRTVFIHCNLEALVMPDGWMPWSEEFALETLYYGEFENSGPGSNVTARVKWSNQIPKQHVLVYSVENFIQGGDWIPIAKS